MNNTAGSSTSTSPIEHLLIGLAVAVALTGAVVWGGAVASSLLTGHHRLPVSAADGVRAIPRLVDAPDAPAQAWPIPVRDEIAPTAIYWLSTALVAVAAVTAAVTAHRLFTGSGPVRRRLGIDAHARFATHRELRPLMVRRPAPGRFVFGTWNGRLLATENRRWSPNATTRVGTLWGRVTGRVRSGQPGDVTSIAICGPTRCGKTSQCAEPGLLDWIGPAVVLSVKRDLMDTTIAHRRTTGEVRVFDPGGYLRSSNSSIQISAGEVGRWSPLRAANTASGAKKAGEALSAWTPQAGVEGGMDFWTSQGKLLFTGLLGAAALAQRPSIRELATWVFEMTMPDPSNEEHRCVPCEILQAAYDNPETEEAASSAVLHLDAIWNKPDDKVIASVYATAQTVCDPWLDPAVAAATDLDGDGTWIDLDWLMRKNKEGQRGNTLYLLVSLDDYKRLSPVLAGLLSDLKAQAYEWEMRGTPLPAPLLMLIDEAGNMPLDWLPEVSSTCAGIGIQLVTIWQSYAQIHEAYGKRADTLLTNHATKLFFPGASDDSTLGYVSKIVGDEQVERQSWSKDAAGGRRSISGQTNNEALVPYFLTRLPKYGTALMIHSNTPPAHVQGRPWWKNRRLAALVPKPSKPTSAPQAETTNAFRRPRRRRTSSAPERAPTTNAGPQVEASTRKVA